MNVSIHQPQYLPWLPYMRKIEESDCFIILDTVDFQKNGLQNRNQIKTAQGAHWLTVPVRQQLGQKIFDVSIDNYKEWRKKHWQTLQQCYRKASAFNMYAQELDQLYSRDWVGLNELNIQLIGMMMCWMGISTPVLQSSKMKATGNGSELVLNLCLEVGATRYLSGISGKNYLDLEAFDSAGVEIVYRPSVLPENYPQQYPQAGFLNHLSAIDLIFNCGGLWRSYVPEEVGETWRQI